MQVPLLDLKAQLDRIHDEVRHQIDEVVESCVFINGPKVDALESRIAEYCGTSHAIGVSSGTDALLVALMALEVGPGDAVLTTPYSFFATAGAVSRLGARPVFVDIDPETYNISVDRIREFIETDPETAATVKAMIPVHLYGQCADLDAITEIAREQGWRVIEDAAQAIGARYQGSGSVRRAGSVGDIGCFSFFPSKNLGGAGDGGMVVTSDQDLAAKIGKLRNHGSHPKYYHDLIGGNFRLDAIQAAVLLAKLPHLEQWHAERQANAAYYDVQLEGLNAVQLPKVQEDRSFHIYNQYVIRAQKRDQLRDFLKSRGVATEVYYPVPFHQQTCFADLGYGAGDFPESEKAAQSTLAIPVYPELTREMQNHVVQSIREFYG
ncbi:MAG: DegT/DnrJ/EryC1/StrS family aminotransferase [Pseudomonadales bacterium]